MKYFSMFSGIGGFEYGINVAHSKRVQQGETERDMRNLDRREISSKPLCVGFSEIDKYATQIYKKHFPNHKEYGNARDIIWERVDDFDVFVGGFPCQAFSIAGKRGGFDDTRGTLFFEIARCIREKQPRLCVLENVKGLLSHDKRNTFFTILTTLDEVGYDCEWQVLNSKNFGVPQNRERVFIIGHLRGGSGRKVFPIRGENPKIDGAVYPCLTPDRPIKRQNGQRFKSKGEVSFTITAQDKHGVYDGCRIRRLTPTECERLQGFPDGWTEKGLTNNLKMADIISISDTQRYKVLGNAVTTNVVKAIFEKIINFPT